MTGTVLLAGGGARACAGLPASPHPGAITAVLRPLPPGTGSPAAVKPAGPTPRPRLLLLSAWNPAILSVRFRYSGGAC